MEDTGNVEGDNEAVLVEILDNENKSFPNYLEFFLVEESVPYSFAGTNFREFLLPFSFLGTF